MHLDSWLAKMGISEREFARRVGLSQVAINRYCNGRIPNPKAMTAIVKATLGEVTPNDFYDFAEQAA